MEICERCAAIGSTCCSKVRDILLTDGDVRRISAQLEQEDFYEYRVPCDPAYLEQDDDPNWNLYTVNPDGTRRVLKRQSNGSCLLLTETGCRLAEEVRPLVCRLFPYEYTEREISGTDAECPAQLLGDGETIYQALRMRDDVAHEWWETLYRELRHHGQ